MFNYLSMQLPESHESKNTIENMEEYSSYFVAPRAMRVDRSGVCHMNESYTCRSGAWWATQLKITKVPEGYIAHIHEMEKKYTWKKESEPWFIGTLLEKCYGKVVAFSIDEYCKTYSVHPSKFLWYVQEVSEVEKEESAKAIIENFKKNLKKDYNKN